jgi:putative ABC transport system permease protein
MILLRLISWPYLRKHLLRSSLTVAGIVLGVGVLVGMRMANESVLGSFHGTVDKIAGETQLQVTAGDPGFEEDVLERVQSVAGVRAASAVIEADAATELPGQGNLLILGVDMTGDQNLRSYNLESADDLVMDDPLVFLAQPDSIIVTRDFAQRNHLQLGSRIPMRTMAGEKQFTIRGIMRAGGMASAFGGNIAIMDVYAVQKIFGRGRHFDRIDVAVKEGYTIDAVRQAIEAAVGPGFIVEPPSGRGARYDSLLAAHRVVVNVSSAFVLLIGMFIIYNSFAIAVTQRRYEIGILRALGATRQQIRTLFLMEGAVEGIVGSLAGLLLGVALARLMMGYFSFGVNFFYGIPESSNNAVVIDPFLLAGSLLVGILTSIVAAWIPAREAARVDPVVALQKGKAQAISDQESRLRLWAALFLAVIAVGCVLFGKARPLFYISLFLSIVAALLLAPSLALAITRFMRPLLCRLRPVEGALAADSLIQAPRRTAATVAALMLSLTLVVGTGGLAAAVLTTINGWMTLAMSADLVLTSSQEVVPRSFRFPAVIGEELKNLEGVARVQMVSMVRITLHGKEIGLVSVEMDDFGSARRKIVAGNEREMYRLAKAGQGLLASETLIGQHHLRLGELMEIPTPAGILRLPIVGIVEDFSHQKGVFLVDREIYKRWWKDDSVGVFHIYLKPGVVVEQARQRILDRFGSRTKLYVITQQEMRKETQRILQQAFSMMYAQLLVAILVAVLGIVNSLTVSIADRRRELGVLQAVGALRNQVRHTIWMEAVCVGFVGLLMGLSLGAIYLYYNVKVFMQDTGGIHLAYEFPVLLALALVPVILGAAFFSSLGPAESAVRGSLVEALEYE